MTTQRRRARPSSAHPPLSPGPSTGRRGCDCASVPAAPELQRAEAERLAGVLKALADPTRLQLLSLVRDSAKGEACVRPDSCVRHHAAHHQPPPADPDAGRFPRADQARQLGVILDQPRPARHRREGAPGAEPEARLSGGSTDPVRIPAGVWHPARARDLRLDERCRRAPGRMRSMPSMPRSEGSSVIHGSKRVPSTDSTWASRPRVTTTSALRTISSVMALGRSSEMSTPTSARDWTESSSRAVPALVPAEETSTASATRSVISPAAIWDLPAFFTQTKRTVGCSLIGRGARAPAAL